MDRKLLSQEIIDIMNYRIQQEEASCRIYEQMKLWFEDKGYSNLAKLYEAYMADELTHAGWSKSFLLDYGLMPSLKALPSPDAEYECHTDIFEETLKHEILITEQVSELATKSLKWNNFVLHSLALKYCAEQQEEVGKAINLLDISKLTSDCLVLDTYVGTHLL